MLTPGRGTDTKLFFWGGGGGGGGGQKYLLPEINLFFYFDIFVGGDSREKPGSTSYTYTT